MRPAQTRDREIATVATLAAVVSLFSFLYCFRQGSILFYGDAVAHINIARRVFDSRTPGLLQLGTVWLPLPHLLMIPFLFSDRLWRTGIGGSLPSMAAYVAGVAGMFRLVREVLRASGNPTRIAPWLAAAIYAANPNLLYLQATAMTEPLYLALFIWTAVYFAEFVGKGLSTPTDGGRSLIKCGLCAAAAALTRYDGWFLAAVVGIGVLAITFKAVPGNTPLRRAVVGFLVLVAAAPVVWLAYNAAIYRNPLEFANGPYSARAIEQKTSVPGFPPHPGSNNLAVAGEYFVKSAQLNMAAGLWMERMWVAVALAGTLLILLRKPCRPLLIFWAPLPFYMLSIAYSGVPIFLPEWWPFSYYNTRYGLQLLPLFAVCGAIIVASLLDRARSNSTSCVMAGAAVLLVSASYASVWRSQPIAYHEAWVNSRTRLALEAALARELVKLPPDSTILMYSGDHVGALQQAGIPLRRTINEGNHRPWKKPSDPEGLWERTLADPARYADYALAMQGDPVDEALSGRHLQTLVKIHTTGQPEATLYSTRW
jgi:hypothetical protein